MAPRDSSFLVRSFAALQPSNYLRVPSEESHEHQENADHTGPEKPYDLAAAARSRLPFLLLRFLFWIVIPTCIVLAIVLVKNPIAQGLHHITNQPELPPRPGADGITEKTHALPLEPVAFDPNQPHRKALVLASYSKQAVDWLSEVPIEWEIYRYVQDSNSTTGLTVPRNQGREAMVYLTYIIDHYNDLPDFVVFHHGHRKAWHQIEPTPMKLRALNLTAVKQDHFVNFRCEHDPGCLNSTGIDLVHVDPDDERTQAHMLPRFWNTMFGNESIWDMGPPPTNVSATCCAQFVVTREAILSRPLAFWQDYRQPLLEDLNEYKPLWGKKTNSYFIGICYEKIWHMVFGQPAVSCPSEDYCHKTQWSDAIVCDRYIGDYDHSWGWESIECVERRQDG